MNGTDMAFRRKTGHTRCRGSPHRLGAAAMVDVAFPVPRPWQRERLTGRAAALLLIVLIHLALVLALLFARSAHQLSEPPPTVVRMIELPAPAPAAAPKAKAAPSRVASPNLIKAPKPIIEVPPQPDAKPTLFKTEMFEAIDISKLPSHKGAAVADGSAGNGTGSADGLGPGIGNGPHGEALYAAQWYREPTDAEINPYLPRHLPPVATADIICRTIERFGVEDCQEMGESPPGTGLSRAIRQAGWQFKVKPVRLGQKFEVGTWVRIHYTITTTPREAQGG